MNNLGAFVEITNILNKYSNTFELVPIPESFPNSAPDYSTQAYFCVEMEELVSIQDYDRLVELGAREECEGMYWVVYS